MGSDQKVLVVEDNEVNQMVIKGMLTKLGFSFDLAKDGEEAVGKANEHPYAVILMDCQMPIMDGYEATQKIREMEADSRHTPIVALTAHAFHEESEKCISVGMDDFLSKPISVDSLKGMLEKWM